MPAFLHLYPGLTPHSYGELDEDTWARLQAFAEQLLKARGLQMH